MMLIKDKEKLKETNYFMALAIEEAKNSTCKKSQRGVVIVKNGEILGEGHNKVTLEELCNPCIREQIKDSSRIELCSAIHAEQMAIIDAMKTTNTLYGSRMYHIKVKDGKPMPSRKPSCTVCSRMICEAGIDVVLLHQEGYIIYSPKEFNRISFDYFLKPRKAIDF